MSRRRSGAAIKSWLSARSDGKEGRFIQVGNSLLLSTRFQGLSAGARFLYLCMAMESGGKRDFTFPLSSAKKYGIAKNSFSRYIKELNDSGFIVVHSMANLRQPNEYSFSFAWKEEFPLN